MIVNFVGNYQNGYVGEQADEVHLVREIEALGHTVRKLPRDEWREHVLDGQPYRNIPTDLKADINIFCKWHHFYDGRFIEELRKRSGAPVFYWVWDYMFDQGFPDWHWENVLACDLYLSNDGAHGGYKDKYHYFPFDVCDGDLPYSFVPSEEIPVLFTGTYLGQGDRVDYLKKINAVHPVTVYSWNYTEWEKNGFTAHPAVYGSEYNETVSKSLVTLGFSVNPHSYGYWSNRVGKVIRTGGCLLQQYAPGMELMIGDLADYFSSPEEACEKIQKYKDNPQLSREMKENAWGAGGRFTSKTRVKQLMILCERYLKEDHTKWNKLP